MSYYQDVYSSPEYHGLTLIGSVSRYYESYSFDLVAVWWHEDGRIFYAQDSGCSCPSPFERHDSISSLDEVQNWMELEIKLLELAPVSDRYSEANESYAADIAELVLKVRQISRG